MILCRGCVVRIHIFCQNIGVGAQQRILHIGRHWEKHLFKKIIHMWRILVAVFSTNFSALHRSIDTRKDVREYWGNIWAEWDEGCPANAFTDLSTTPSACQLGSQKHFACLAHQTTWNLSWQAMSKMSSKRYVAISVTIYCCLDLQKSLLSSQKDLLCHQRIKRVTIVQRARQLFERWNVLIPLFAMQY